MKQIRYNLIKNTIKHNISQILALTEKNIKLQTRFKYQLVFSYVKPIITLMIPLIIFQKLFDFNQSLGPWTNETYLVFVLSTYTLSLLKGMIGDFPDELRREKFWKTLPGLIIAPFNRFDLLMGIFLSNLILISIPFALIIILNLIVYPISIITLLFVLFIYCLIALVFSGIGLILGIFAISNENIWRILSFGIGLVFWSSCISYPFNLFPDVLQFIIRFNPFYYIFTILRFSWVDNNILLTLSNLYPHFIILLIMGIILPTIAVYIFNKIFKKYGIVGY